MDDLERLKELAEKATPGPWDWGKYGLDAILEKPFAGMRQAVLGAQYEYDSGADVTCSEADAAYIAAANPEVVLKLIARVRELESNQRTPGTVEVCERWGSAHCSDHPQSDFDVSLCRHRNCPRSVSPSP